MFKLRTIFGYEYYHRPQVNVDKRVFGSEYGGHCVALNHLDENSVVYSAGLGLDITFDEEPVSYTHLTLPTKA